jgi:hypothetical protein
MGEGDGEEGLRFNSFKFNVLKFIETSSIERFFS